MAAAARPAAAAGAPAPPAARGAAPPLCLLLLPLRKLQLAVLLPLPPLPRLLACLRLPPPLPPCAPPPPAGAASPPGACGSPSRAPAGGQRRAAAARHGRERHRSGGTLRASAGRQASRPGRFPDRRPACAAHHLLSHPATHLLIQPLLQLLHVLPRPLHHQQRRCGVGRGGAQHTQGWVGSRAQQGMPERHSTRAGRQARTLEPGLAAPPGGIRAMRNCTTCQSALRQVRVVYAVPVGDCSAVSAQQPSSAATCQPTCRLVWAAAPPPSPRTASWRSSNRHTSPLQCGSGCATAEVPWAKGAQQAVERCRRCCLQGLPQQHPLHLPPRPFGSRTIVLPQVFGPLGRPRGSLVAPPLNVAQPPRNQRRRAHVGLAHRDLQSFS